MFFHFDPVTPFQVITLPVEFDARRRAKEQLTRQGIVHRHEIRREPGAQRRGVDLCGGDDQLGAAAPLSDFTRARPVMMQTYPADFPPGLGKSPHTDAGADLIIQMEH